MTNLPNIRLEMVDKILQPNTEVPAPHPQGDFLLPAKAN